MLGRNWNKSTNEQAREWEEIKMISQMKRNGMMTRLMSSLADAAAIGGQQPRAGVHDADGGAQMCWCVVRSASAVPIIVAACIAISASMLLMLSRSSMQRSNCWRRTASAMARCRVSRRVDRGAGLAGGSGNGDGGRGGAATALGLELEPTRGDPAGPAGAGKRWGGSSGAARAGNGCACAAGVLPPEKAPMAIVTAGGLGLGVIDTVTERAGLAPGRGGKGLGVVCAAPALAGFGLGLGVESPPRGKAEPPGADKVAPASAGGMQGTGGASVSAAACAAATPAAEAATTAAAAAATAPRSTDTLCTRPSDAARRLVGDTGVEGAAADADTDAKANRPPPPPPPEAAEEEEDPVGEARGTNGGRGGGLAKGLCATGPAQGGEPDGEATGACAGEDEEEGEESGGIVR